MTEQLADSDLARVEREEGLVAKGLAASATTLFGNFVSEPRLFGATIRTRF